MEWRFENLDNILRDWEKDKIQKSLVKAKNRYEKREEEKNCFLFKLIQKKYSNCLSRQSSETMNQKWFPN